MHQMIEDNLCVRLEALVRNVLLSPSRKLNIRRRLSVFMLLWCQFIGMIIFAVLLERRVSAFVLAAVFRIA